MLQKEKFVEHNANAVAAGRVAGVDPIEQITKRCIRIVNTQVDEMGGCALCRRHEFSRSGFGPRTVMLCDQCEKEFHVGCLREHDMDDLKEVPKGKWFCCHDCKRINSSLQNKDPDIKWRLICGRRASSIEAGSLLSQALSIFHEQFDPIADAAGRDLLPDMVHGKSTREWDFGGMYCAILTISSQVVSAAAFRIFGKEVAELPLVATRSDCQGQGYFQTLFSCLEGLLGVLEVRSLVLPAAEGAESIWTNKFGFNKVTQEQRNNFRRDYQMVTFQGTLMLQKLVPR
ncbi:Increased DNA methylation 1 [Vitis vinifera]|uniref:Increased DNA methylation 1 n=1 Tax=Vitis vinifera TaxID=29760 RepID=A0A438KFP7_VITVI|nr:Increased DNA methylation 1 [Vitis vinifera]